MLTGSCPKCSSDLLEGNKKTAWCRECFYFFTPEEITERISYSEKVQRVLKYRTAHREEHNNYMREYMKRRRVTNRISP